MANLREKLSSFRKVSQCAREQKFFYPYSEIEKLLKLDDIRASISTIPSLHGNDRDAFRYATLIREAHLKTFAILLLNGDHKYILEFLFRRETDSRIPYTENGLYFLPTLVSRAFVERQSEFNPVIFEKGDIHRELGKNEILPVLYEDKVGEGGFGIVWKMCLYPSCQKLVLIDPNKTEQAAVVARKELKEVGDGENERAILELLQTLHHPNIIEFLGSYTHHGVHNLLFPYVPLNLMQRFEMGGQRPPTLAPMFLSGMYGIGSALAKIHDFTFKTENIEISRTGYHHDLRPANILVQGDTFLIADFGLSKLKPDDQDSKSRLRGGHDDYLGPEAFNDVDWTNGVVGRALDIWAFGCILAEVASFLQGRSIENFRLKRKATHGGLFHITDHAFHLNGQVRPAVVEWLSELECIPNSWAVHDLVQLILRMLNGNPYKRMKITAVASELASLALDSSISSIHKRFRAESNINSNFNILLILEGKRFEAWKLTIESLHQDEKLQKIDDLFAKLANLCSVLDEVNLRAYPTEVVTVEPIESTREGLLSKLWSTVDSICQSLPNILQEKIEERWSRAVCEIQDIEVLNAIRAAPKPERYRAVGVSAAMRYMSRVISDSIRVGGRSRFIDAGCVRLDEVSVAARDASLSTQEAPLVGDNSRTMGYYTGEHGESRVMIEWKLYDEQWQDGPGSELRETMDKLVNLLDPQETPRNGVAKHRILDCVGYFHEPHNFRFGFLYLLKPSSTVERTANSQLYSVNNIIRMTTPDLENTTRPVLGDIFCLAKDLASCLHALHDAGWFHKNISSHHLLVFCPSPEEAYRHISSAVLVGFNDSRPEASRFTLGPKHDFQHYQHPTYQMGVPFRRTFDFFSLGVVLLELGLSYPVSVLRSWHPEVRTEEGFRKKLLKSYVPQLGERMGALYRDAVRFCLDAENVVGFTQEDAEAGRRAQELFSSDVVVPLFRCFA